MNLRSVIELADALLEEVNSDGPYCPEDWDSELPSVTRLAQGYFSVVYLPNGQDRYVIKVVVREDDSAPCYLAWARAHPGKHVPVVHYLKRSGQRTVAVLDKLRKLNANELDLYNRSVYHQNMHSLAALSSRTSLQEAAYRVLKFFAGVASSDMHSGNVLVNKNNELVLTDPVSFSGTEQSRLLRAGIERAYGLTE